MLQVLHKIGKNLDNNTQITINMAGRSCRSGSLIIYILVALSVAQFYKHPMKLLNKDAKLQMLMAASDASQPKIPESRLKMKSPQTKTTNDVKACSYGHTSSKYDACR